MKKINYLLIAFLFLSVIARSQNTCIVSKNLFTTISDTIPPVGTISPVGPDLGCLTATERQVWFYLPVCQDVYVTDFYTDANHGPTDTIGAILYGPFSQKVSNCSDLNAAKTLACSANTVLGNKIFINNTLLEANYYYLVVTFSDAITGNVNIYKDSWGGGFYQNCPECNNQVSVIYQNNLCLVSVDTSINKCVLTWEEFPGQNLLGYTIMRETSLTGVFDSLTTIPVGSLSTYTDMTSSPAQHNFTYQLIPSDSCGQHPALPFIPQLTSIHLISFAGGNNQANLIWNNVYSNNDFIPQYYIYRNNNSTGWQVIDSIGITLSTITYTDIFAPAGNNQYTVELRKLVPCVPMRTTSTAYQSVFSNTSVTTVTGTEELVNNTFIKIYPNPVREFLSIYSNLASSNELTITLFNLYGQELKTLYSGKASVGIHEEKFSLKEYPPGIYFVKMNVGGKEEMQKVVKL